MKKILYTYTLKRFRKQSVREIIMSTLKKYEHNMRQDGIEGNRNARCYFCKADTKSAGAPCASCRIAGDLCAKSLTTHGCFGLGQFDSRDDAIHTGDIAACMAQMTFFWEVLAVYESRLPKRKKK